MKPTHPNRRQALQAAAALSLGALGAAAARAQTGPSGPLVLYTSQPDRDARETVAAFNRVHPAVAVEIFRSGTTEVMSRLRTEFAAGAPRPDVLLIADAISMEALKAEGRLLRLQGLDTVAIPSRYHDAERTYMGTKLISSGLVVHTASPFKPAAWKDLLHPSLKNQVVMPSPLYSGAAAITLGAWVRHPDLGWGFVEALKAHGAIAVKGNGAVLQQVAGGERRAGVLVDFMALNAKAKGSPVDFVIPREGLSFVTEPAAILNTTRNAAAAQAFVAFLVSRAGQEFSTRLGYFPLLADVAPPPGYPKPQTLRFLPQDGASLLASAESERKRFASLFGG